MNMTRRAFFMLPTRPVGDDLENAGEWLRRKRQKGTVPLPGGGGAEMRNGLETEKVTRGIGLRNARANMRRKDYE